MITSLADIIAGAVILAAMIPAVWEIVVDFLADCDESSDEPPWLNNGEEGRRGWGCDE
jgi:hypothetical protein